MILVIESSVLIISFSSMGMYLPKEWQCLLSQPEQFRLVQTQNMLCLLGRAKNAPTDSYSLLPPFLESKQTIFHYFLHQENMHFPWLYIE